ncbi:PREDICTED: UDP-glycosyltransferase 71D1-like [Tarenaya hassleriana]|uniref:UDP-glycosyltransferase 71D1-like n=1 Tax=Tarenaya hassleriana TaxID=28532 RepID=UPI00053C210B|nr:PREDICTED: UDP-glycosyltransferase 71D1-like [Tarenaya hassleriana]
MTSCVIMLMSKVDFALFFDEQIKQFVWKKGLRKGRLIKPISPFSAEMKGAELIFIPTPGSGHLVSVLEFAKRLLDQDDMIWMTIILMKYLLEKQSNDTSKFERNSDTGLVIPGFVNLVPSKCSTDNFLGQQGCYPSVYTIGPMPGLQAPPPHSGLDLNRQSELIEWPDDQPECSVVFLCFGSGGILGDHQVKEITKGLEQSGCRFIWSIRTHQPNAGDLLPEGFLEGVGGWGMICGWTPQLEIQSHKSVGGFVSHCLWSSILESHVANLAGQQLKAFMTVEEFGLAVDMRLDFRGNGDDAFRGNG